MTTQTFMPSARAYAKNTLAIGGIALPTLGLLIVFNDDKRLLFAAMAIAAVGSIGGVLLYIARARIYVTEDSIGRRGFLRTHWMSRKAVQRGLLVRSLRQAQPRPPTSFCSLLTPRS